MSLLFILLHVYFVSFTDKPEKSAPALSPRAVEQRAKWNIPTDEKDYPVAKIYVDSLCRAGAKIYHTSRWFNGATCEMTPTMAAKAAGYSFVQDVELTRDDSPNIYAPKRKRVASSGHIGDEEPHFAWTDEQLATYNLLPLHKAGFEGQGILMAVCDGAFYNANTLSCFRADKLELGHFDFTDDPTSFYGSIYGAHGTECLSTISGITDDFYGAATKAQYYLMRSEEEDHESPKEMDNLTVALETADSLGVNIFSVSLGYAYFDNDDWTLSKSALDGKTTRSSRAATIAARKGMLVCVAAGNEGNKPWHTISSPADADSVLTVGAVATDSIIGNFSSYGPSADGRIKPEVCAVGVQTTLIQPSNNTTITANGTSFATPLIAGFAASLWSALPDENAMQIRERIIKSAHLYPSYDADHRLGYGIPDAWKAYTLKRPTGMDNGQWTMDNGQCQKVLHNGQLLIIHGDKVYNAQGQPMP